MSWRSSFFAAVIVIAAGAATGALVGTQAAPGPVTRTVVRTVKLVRTVAAKATATTNTGTTTTSTPTSPPGPGTGGAQERYLSDYLESEGGVNAINSNTQNASMLNNPNQQELQGQLYQHAVAFQLSAQAENVSASVQIPTPNFTRFSSPAVGLETNANANAVYHLTIYKNNDNSPHSRVLYQAPFQGPSTVRKVSFPLQGAADILLVWTHKATEPDNSDTFVLADPALTGP